MNFTMTIQHDDVQVSISSAKAMTLGEMSSLFDNLIDKAGQAVATAHIEVPKETKKAPYGLKADGTPKKRPGRPSKK
jgi:hypothetical protein